MANPWFRMYAEIVHDPKVQMMSETMQRRFVMLMAMRCGNDDETFHETEIAFVLRISEAEAAETKAVFLAKGFIDQDWRLVNWEKRQFVSDTSTERVKRFRNRHKAGAEGDDVPATPTGGQDETPRNVSETPPDTDTDTEQKQNRTEKIKTLPAASQPAASEPVSMLTLEERHAACRDHVHAYWRHTHPEDKGAPWDGSEAKKLDLLLKAKPDLTPERFRQLLMVRLVSDANQAERPRVWLERLTDYAGGPLDRFKLPAALRRNPELTVGMNTCSEQAQTPEEFAAWVAAKPKEPTAVPTVPVGPPLPSVEESGRATHLEWTKRRKGSISQEDQDWLDAYNATLEAAQAHRAGAQQTQAVSA